MKFFGNDYDCVLFKILNNDKKNEKIIRDFLENIPSEFLRVVQRELDNLGNKEYHFEYLGNDENIYTCKIGDDDILCVSRLSKQLGVYFTDIILELNSYNQIDWLSLYSSQFLGSVKYDYNNVDGRYTLDCNCINYSLVRTSFGNYINVSDKLLNSRKFNRKIRVLRDN